MISKLEWPSEDQSEFAAQATRFLKRCANPDRFRILIALREKDHTVAELGHRLDIRQPALSQSLGELRRTGLVAARKASRHVVYSLADARVIGLIDALTTIFSTIPMPRPLQPAISDPAWSRSPHVA